MTQKRTSQQEAFSLSFPFPSCKIADVLLELDPAHNYTRANPLKYGVHSIKPLFQNSGHKRNLFLETISPLLLQWQLPRDLDKVVIERSAKYSKPFLQFWVSATFNDARNN